LPWWLKYANRLVILLNRLVLSIGTMYILLIPGCKTGKMRSTPVSVLKVDGKRYILTGFALAAPRCPVFRLDHFDTFELCDRVNRDRKV
jgi:hypothetical protein